MKPSILDSDDFKSKYPEMSSQEGYSFITSKRFTAKDIGISYRVLNHWCEEGLVDDNREKGKEQGWRKLSLKDLFWIKILETLRAFNLSLSQLKRVRGYIFLKYNDQILPLMEQAIGMCMIGRPYCLIVAQDGYSYFTTPQMVERVDTNPECKAYLKINLNNVFQALFPEQDYKPKKSSGNTLTPAERKVMEILRSDFDRLEIHKKNGEIETIDVSQKREEFTLTAEMIRQIGFGQFHGTIKDGKIVCTEISAKRKLK